MIDLKANPFFLDDESISWVYATLDKMTLEEKVGQLFCVLYRESTDEEVESIHSILSPGGGMFRPMPLIDAVKLSQKVQKVSKIPMLIAANLEKGGNGIVAEGTILGSPMEVAATDDIGMAEKMGVVCAREAKAVGANWAFAPIIDIDTNFRNPITNTRTFGSNANRVKEMGLAYAKTVQGLGLAACSKHFPGDGQDERDQHLVTSINNMSCEEWDATYGQAYRACIEAGVLTCMVGHIMQPAYSKKINPGLRDGDILPGTLSKELMGGLLREQLGFNGLIVTDATTMAGFTISMSRKKAVPFCIAAGADMFLFARSLEEDYAYMMDGVREGVISGRRLDDAVTRILATKAALKLHRSVCSPNLENAQRIVGCQEHKDWAMECADKAITLVKEENGVLPLTKEKYRKILFYALEPVEGGAGQYKVIPVCEKIKEKLEAEGFSIDLFIPESGTEGRTVKAAEIIDTYDLIIYAANYVTKSNQTVVRIEWAQPMGADCPHYLNDIPTVFISLENPYHLLDVPRIKTYINTYNGNEAVLSMLIEKLMGRSAFQGINPTDPFCGMWDTRL